jgi:pimeloyl-ACP methyl ester carboxylesterase
VPEFKSFDGEHIHFADQGTGEVVVLLHGFLVDAKRNWFAPGIAQALLETRFRVVAPDLRGHGASASPSVLEAYTNDAVARDVIALTDHLGLERYALIGYSLGAIVAVRVTLRDPRVSRLVLSGMGDCLADDTWTRPRQLAAALWNQPTLEPLDADAQFMLEYVRREGLNAFALGAVQAGHVVTRATQLERLTLPTLVLSGRDDHVNGDFVALKAMLPNSSLRLVDGDHVSAITRPEFAQGLIKFLNETH